MDHNFKLPDQLSMQEIYRLVESPVGQQLIALIQQHSSSEFQQAMDRATKGDLTQAKQALANILADPQAQKLLKELGR